MPLRVLVVEDHKGMASLISALGEFCPTAGYRVVSIAEDTATTLKACAEFKPDMIILDVFLRKESGLDVGREIRKQFPDIAILFLSASEETVIIREAWNMGARGYLAKSFDHYDQVVAAIHQVAGGKLLFPSDALNTDRSALKDLTDRQIHIIAQRAKGRTNGEIARDLCVSEKTVEQLLTSAYGKLNVKNCDQAIFVLSKLGVI